MAQIQYVHQDLRYALIVMAIGWGMNVAKQTAHSQKSDHGVHHLQLVLPPFFLLQTHQHLHLATDELYISTLLDQHTLTFLSQQKGGINFG